MKTGGIKGNNSDCVSCLGGGAQALAESRYVTEPNDFRLRKRPPPPCRLSRRAWALRSLWRIKQSGGPFFSSSPCRTSPQNYWLVRRGRRRRGKDRQGRLLAEKAGGFSSPPAHSMLQRGPLSGPRSSRRRSPPAPPAGQTPTTPPSTPCPGRG